jgi:PEP-CTERM motif
MRYTLFTGASSLAFAGALAIGFGSPAMAGNIVLTGHDNDFHCFFGSGSTACANIGAAASFVRNGSILPVLAIDAGSELTGSLGAEGIPFVAVAPGAVTGGMFNHSIYSAFVVASVTTCGGCDNPPGTGTLLAGFSTQIDSFFNAGGGIYGLSGAGDPNAFAYVPQSGGTTTAIFSSSGFVETPTGLAAGFSAVNGDQTHNTFAGFAPFYKVAETFGVGGPAVTIFGAGGSITCTGTHCHIGGVPEPSTWAVMGLGFFGLGLAARRKRKSGQLPAVA